MHDSWEGIVRGLRSIHMIIGMNRVLGSQGLTQHLVCSIGDDFVGTHIGLRPRPCLPDGQGEVIVEFAIAQLSCSLADSIGELLIQGPQVTVRTSCCCLLDSKCVYQFVWEALDALAEDFKGSLCLSTPVTTCVNLDFAEGVTFYSMRLLYPISKVLQFRDHLTHHFVCFRVGQELGVLNLPPAGLKRGTRTGPTIFRSQTWFEQRSTGLTMSLSHQNISNPLGILATIVARRRCLPVGNPEFRILFFLGELSTESVPIWKQAGIWSFNSSRWKHDLFVMCHLSSLPSS